ncbi:elongation factor P maturation arginine rhamnosyltransferase EarP [Alkalimonas sp. NCh-2]|uniref:elongation factor P maturation arginine rhamnosyltransferase EarP n=1 Tax=Alkalimonas sp. NCh-2 TaxID=3144846 RepID=UPI0031F6217C
MMRWDIFCRVIDNFGDIGVCWRLARQLSSEHGCKVRLWVDDLLSFQRICAEVQPGLSRQVLTEGVEVWHWQPEPDALIQQAGCAEVVIEAFACELPEGYVHAMAAAPVKPVWLNLEYLSAESWVLDCHALPSPHPSLPLQKHFFFPGFLPGTGGLLREGRLIDDMTAWLQQGGKKRLLGKLGIAEPERYQQLICLFAYRHSELLSLLSTWAEQEARQLCLVPEGALADELRALLPELTARSWVQLGNTTLQVLPFINQQQFDQLLWCADINFVRGEDSLVRAIWAGKPFVWQLYPQDEDAHLDKLQAFWHCFAAGMEDALQQALWQFWLNWNQQAALVAPWQQLTGLRPEWQWHCLKWRGQLCQQGDLAKNLVRFVENKFILTANFS